MSEKELMQFLRDHLRIEAQKDYGMYDDKGSIEIEIHLCGEVISSTWVNL